MHQNIAIFVKMAASDAADGPNLRPWNPLSQDPIAHHLSSYASYEELVVLHPLAPGCVANAALQQAHDQLRKKVLGEGYPCVGARSAFNRHSYRFGLFPELASRNSARAVCHDLYEFCHEFPIIDDNFITFVAMFHGPAIKSELHFESLLWRQLQMMHDVDAAFFNWDRQVDSNPESPDFSFSIGGRAIFVVGMHEQASRMARNFPYPTLVFNLHEQFERLRQRGKFEGMKQMIRARDMAFQGSINPMLDNFGNSSEARQYSGRLQSEEWQCPFHQHKPSGKEPV